MKFKSILLSLGFITIPFNTFAQEAEPTFKANPNLAKALSHVDTDGESLSISHEKDFLEDLAKYYDAMLTPIFEMDEGTRFINFNRMLHLFGLNGIKATASSSKQHEGHYINKFFIQTDQQQKGIWSLWGKADQASVSPSFAPADTNLLLETQLNSQQLYDIIIELLRIVNPEAAEETVQNMKQDLPPLGMNMKELLAKIDTRIAVVSTIDIKDTLVDVSKPPKYVASARIDNIAKLLWPIVQTEMANLGEFETNGNQHTMSLPDIESELGPIIVTLHFDLDKDYIWITTDKKHLASCRDPKAAKLESNEHYKSAMQKLPKTGCAQLYLSKEFSTELVKLSAKSLDFAGEDEPIPSIQKSVSKLIPHVTKGQGITWIMQKNKDGILSVSNTPFRIRGGMIQYVGFMSTMASIATPLVLNKRQAADRVKNIGHLKQLSLVLVEYEDEFGELPKKYDDLKKLKTIDPATLAILGTMNTDQGKLPVVYIHRKNPKAGQIIMHTPAPIEGKHVYLTSDYAVIVVPAEQLEALLK